MTQKTFRFGFYLGPAAAVALGLFLAHLWNPSRQVELHTQHLIASIEDRNWSKFASFLGDSYRDQWSQDRALVIQRSRAIFGYLRGVHIQARGITIEAGGRTGLWRAKIAVEGADNSELAYAIKERVNRLTTPFNLEWRQVSAKPWDWKLMRVSNEQLEIPQGDDQFP